MMISKANMIMVQVRKREKMAKLREEIAVQKAKETELNRTIHITGSPISHPCFFYGISVQ